MVIVDAYSPSAEGLFSLWGGMLEIRDEGELNAQPGRLKSSL